MTSKLYFYILQLELKSINLHTLKPTQNSHNIVHMIQQNQTPPLKEVPLAQKQQKTQENVSHRISYQLIQQLESIQTEQALKRLALYFPFAREDILVLQNIFVKKFIRLLINKYLKVGQSYETVEHIFPPKQEMVKIINQLMPQLIENVNPMSQQQIRIVFDEVMTQIKKVPPNVFRFSYLQRHPFEVKVSKIKSISLNFTKQEIDQFIKKLTLFELDPDEAELTKNQSPKRTLEQMQSSNLEEINMEESDGEVAIKKRRYVSSKFAEKNYSQETPK